MNVFMCGHWHKISSSKEKASEYSHYKILIAYFTNEFSSFSIFQDKSVWEGGESWFLIQYSGEEKGFRAFSSLVSHAM